MAQIDHRSLLVNLEDGYVYLKCTVTLAGVLARTERHIYNYFMYLTFLQLAISLCRKEEHSRHVMNGSVDFSHSHYFRFPYFESSHQMTNYIVYSP